MSNSRFFDFMVWLYFFGGGLWCLVFPDSYNGHGEQVGIMLLSMGLFYDRMLAWRRSYEKQD